jgi:small-conductance mechanosensitive channel
MDLGLLQKPLLHVFGHDVSFLGIVAFMIWFSIGVFAARALQSEVIRRFLSRLKIDTNLIAILTTILSLAVLVFFIITAVNAAGVPLSWKAALPGLNHSLFQIFLHIAL